MGLAPGQVKFTLELARNLKNKELVGRQDPYCIITCGMQVQRSMTCKKGGKNPMWYQTFTFNVLHENELRIEIKDEDVLHDDFVGSAIIYLTKARLEGKDRVDVPVFYKNNCIRGQLYGQLEFVAWDKGVDKSSDRGSERSSDRHYDKTLSTSSSYSGSPSDQRDSARKVQSSRARLLSRSPVCNQSTFLSLPGNVQELHLEGDPLTIALLAPPGASTPDSLPSPARSPIYVGGKSSSARIRQPDSPRSFGPVSADSATPALTIAAAAAAAVLSSATSLPSSLPSSSLPSMEYNDPFIVSSMPHKLEAIEDVSREVSEVSEKAVPATLNGVDKPVLPEIQKQAPSQCATAPGPEGHLQSVEKDGVEHVGKENGCGDDADDDFGQDDWVFQPTPSGNITLTTEKTYEPKMSDIAE